MVQAAATVSYSIANWCYGLQSKSPWPDCVERLIGYGNTVGSYTSVTQAGHCCNSSIGIVAVFIISCLYDDLLYLQHVDVIKWKHFPRYWPCVRGIYRSLVNNGRLFRRSSKKTPKLRVTGLWIHRWPVKSPHKGPVTRKMFPFDDVIMGISMIRWAGIRWA